MYEQFEQTGNAVGKGEEHDGQTFVLFALSL